MFEHARALSMPMLAVGAAFDYHAGRGLGAARVDATVRLAMGVPTRAGSRAACGGATSCSTLVTSWASSGSTRVSVFGARRRRPSSNHGTRIPAPSRHGSAGPDTSTTRHRRAQAARVDPVDPCSSAVHHRFSASAISSRGGVFSQYSPHLVGTIRTTAFLADSRAERHSPLRAVSEHFLAVDRQTRRGSRSPARIPRTRPDPRRSPRSTTPRSRREGRARLIVSGHSATRCTSAQAGRASVAHSNLPIIHAIRDPRSMENALAYARSPSQHGPFRRLRRPHARRRNRSRRILGDCGCSRRRARPRRSRPTRSRARHRTAGARRTSVARGK